MYIGGIGNFLEFEIPFITIVSVSSCEPVQLYSFQWFNCILWTIKMDSDRDLTFIEKLQSTEQWPIYKFRIRVLMKASDLWEIVSGEVRKPVAEAQGTRAMQDKFDESLKTWNKKDSKAQTLIVTSVGQEPLLHIMNCVTSRDMWLKLNNVYEQKSKASIQLLRQTFYSFNKSSEDSMSVHISKLRNIVQQLKNMGENISDSMVVSKMLMTLPTEFNHFYSAWWESTSADQRTLSNLTSRLVMEERRLKSNLSNELSKAFIAKRHRLGLKKF